MPKVIRFHRLGGPEVLKVEQVELAAPMPGEVQIRVHALGLNRAEALFRSGLYIEEPEFPSGSGLEAAGVIECVGSGVHGWTPGDRVAVVPPVSMKQHPTQGELINVAVGRVVPIPPGQSFEEAAATWMAYLTAYGALVDVAAVNSGEHVVITAASSSVGLAAIQLVNALGGLPIALTRSDRKREPLVAAGAAHVVTLDQDRVAEAIREITGAAGARVIFDAVGGKLLPVLVSAAAADGIVISYGALDVCPSELPPAALLAKSLTLRGYLVHELLRNPGSLSIAKEFILKRIASGDLVPKIARTFPFEEITAAYRFLESNAQFGKVVVKIQSDAHVSIS